MKKIILHFTSIFFHTLFTLAQFTPAQISAQQWSWLNDLGETNTQGTSVAISNSGDVFALVGRNHYNSKRYVERYDAAGNLVWSKQWDVFTDIAVYPNNDFVGRGMLTKTIGFGNDTVYYEPGKYSFVGFFDENAKLKYHLNIKGDHNYVHSIRTNGNGETFMMGGLRDTININGYLLINTDTTDYTFIVKLNQSYQVIWSKVLNLSASPACFAIDKDNNMFISGYFNTDLYLNNSLHLQKSNLNYDSYVMKINATGTIGWTKHLKGAWGVYEMGSDNTGAFYATGNFSDTLKIDSQTRSYQCVSNGCIESFVAKFTSSGNLLWLTQIGKVINPDQYTFKVTPQGNTYFTGGIPQTIFVGSDSLSPPSSWWSYTMFIARINSSGNLNWKFMPVQNNAHGNTIACDRKGDLIWSGMAHQLQIGNDSVIKPNSQLLPNIFMAHFNDTISFSATGINDALTGETVIYPNPSGGKFYLKLKDEATDLTVQIYNITGSVILNKRIGHEKEIDLSGHPAGIYFVEALSGNKIYRQKLIIH
jgi:hypothetical protein